MLRIARAVLVAGVAVGPAVAGAQVLDFEGIAFDPVGCTGTVGNFYNGGGGTNHGIDFSSNALVLSLRNPTLQCPSSNTSRGGIGNPASQGLGLFFLSGAQTFMNKVTGFTTGFSFFYSAVNQGGSFDVWSGLDGTGSLLAHLDLPVTPSNPGGTFACFGAAFCPFYAAGVSFAGVAQSVTFSGVANQIVFDDVTFGSQTPGVVPEPGTIIMVATGLLGLAIPIRRRRNNA
jgi:hypothetical protein